jgi:hypothetical protein
VTFKHSFAPVVNEHTRVLVLGTSAWQASAAQSQYDAPAQKHSVAYAFRSTASAEDSRVVMGESIAK